MKGRLEEARSLYRDLSQEDPGDLTYLGRLGTIAAHVGDQGAVTRVGRELAAVEGPYVRRLALAWQARIAAVLGVLGDADRAVTLLQQAHEAGLGHGLWLHIDPDLASTSGHPGFEEFVRPKA